eukprot:846903-Rhodomonas_salina.1
MCIRDSAPPVLALPQLSSSLSVLALASPPPILAPTHSRYPLSPIPCSCGTGGAAEHREALRGLPHPDAGARAPSPQPQPPRIPHFHHTPKSPTDRPSEGARKRGSEGGCRRSTGRGRGRVNKGVH